MSADTDTAEQADRASGPMDAAETAAVTAAAVGGVEETHGLGRRSVRGAMWAVGGQALAEPLRILGTAILARLLSPGDFGLIGMAAVFFGLTAIATDLGPSAAIIGRKRLTEGELSSLFWGSTGVGVLLAAAAVASSPLVARLYGEPRVAPVFAAMSLTVLLAAEALVHNALLRRRFDFRVPALANLASVAANTAVALTAAVLGFGYWSLVAGTLAGVATSVAIVQARAGFRPRLHFAWSEVRPFLSFSSAVTTAEIANYGSTNVDNLLVGRLLGAASLGIYALAYNLVTYPVRMFSALVAQATLPALCRLSEDAERMRAAYLKATTLSSAIVIPTLAAAVIAAPQIVVGVYGADWAAAVLPFRLLCVAGMARSVSVFGRAAFKAAERPAAQLRWDLALLALVALGAAAGSRWGVNGVAAAVAVATGAVTLGVQVEVARTVGLSPASVTRSFAPAASLSASSAAIALAVARLSAAAGSPDLLTAAVSVLAALAGTWVWGRLAFGELREMEGLVVSILSRRNVSEAAAADVPPASAVVPAAVDETL